MSAISTIGARIDRWDNGCPAHREQARLIQALKLERSSRHLCSEAFITFISKPRNGVPVLILAPYRKGTAICGIPGEVSRAMLRGWHANNGAALGDLRLGFVCSKQSVDGQDALEGYYYQYDQPLEPNARLVFARHLEAPLFDPATAPALPVASWPRPRLEKAYRNYAMEYVKTAGPVMVQLFGPEEGGHLLHLTGKLIGMQYFDDVAQALSQTRGGAKEFAAFLRALFEIQDDVAETTKSEAQFEIVQQTWKLMANVADYHPGCAKVLEGLFEGLAFGCGRHIPVRMRPSGSGKPPFVWTIG